MANAAIDLTGDYEVVDLTEDSGSPPRGGRGLQQACAAAHARLHLGALTPRVSAAGKRARRGDLRC
jgi:hypothetical protein